MKTVCIILVIIGVTSCKTYREKFPFGAKNASLNVKILKQEHYTKDTIRITIENRSKKKIYYIMTLEGFEIDHWFEVDNDMIYNADKASKKDHWFEEDKDTNENGDKASKIDKIEMTSKVYKYDVKQIDSFHYEDNKRLFRVKVVYWSSLEKLGNLKRAREVVSMPFKIILTE